MSAKAAVTGTIAPVVAGTIASLVVLLVAVVSVEALLTSIVVGDVPVRAAFSNLYFAFEASFSS